MIKQIFLPQRIGSYVLFTQNRVGCEVGKHELRATIIRAHGYKKIIEKYVSIPIDQDITLPFFDRLKQAALKLKEQIGSSDELRLVFSGALMIFKEIVLPFTDREKIKKVIPFEISQQLPFSVHDAYLDVIILEQLEKSSRVLVVASKREQLDEYLKVFDAVPLRPNAVTVDIIELLGFANNIPEYRSLEQLWAYIDIDFYATRLMLIRNNKLIGLRYIPRGLQNIINYLKDHGSAHATFDQILRYGTRDANFKEALSALIEEIQFTINATLLPSKLALSKIFIAGCGAEIAHMTDYFQTIFTVPVEKFYAHKIIQNGEVQTEQRQGIPCEYEVSVAAALISPLTEDFNLLSMVSSPEQERLGTIRLIIASLLALLIILSLILHSFFTIRSLRNEAHASEQEAIARLKKIFSLPKGTNTLESAVASARLEVAKEEQIWFSLSTDNRFSFLTYLQELSARIDREGLGLDLKRLAIRRGDDGAQDTLTMEGSVRDYDALRSFEESLAQSKLFKSVPKLQETKFTLNLFLEKNSLEL